MLGRWAPLALPLAPDRFGDQLGGDGAAGSPGRAHCKIEGSKMFEIHQVNVFW